MPKIYTQSTQYFLAGDTLVEDMTYWGLGGCEGLTGKINHAWLFGFAEDDSFFGQKAFALFRTIFDNLFSFQWALVDRRKGKVLTDKHLMPHFEPVALSSEGSLEGPWRLLEGPWWPYVRRWRPWTVLGDKDTTPYKHSFQPPIIEPSLAICLVPQKNKKWQVMTRGGVMIPPKMMAKFSNSDLKNESILSRMNKDLCCVLRLQSLNIHDILHAQPPSKARSTI